MGIKSILQPHKEAGTWKWGLVALVFLAPFFFLTYGFANQYAASLTNVPSIVFEWEKNIPLWSWTIIPYWSIDLFYGLSLLLCWNKFELKQQTLRLFLAQIIAVSCFLLFPLKFSFERPPLDGFFGIWFDVLMGFDKPFNQAPSLHIVLLVILWDFYRRHVQNHWKYLVDFWSLLIGISVLTTWQHHFIDIPTGILVGALCLWLFPVSATSAFQSFIQQRTSQHFKLALYYFIGAILLTTLALFFRNSVLWLLYPALSLCLVSLAYITVRPQLFQKQKNGKITTAALILYAPYLGFAWLNSRIWTKKHPEDSFIIQHKNIDIFLGRIPNLENSQHYNALFDCCAELPLSQNMQSYQSYFSLDLTILQLKQLDVAVQQFDQLWQEQLLNIQSNNKLLIFCALGYSRSTSILIAWLIKNKITQNIDEAILLIRKNRPWIVLKPIQIEQINLYIQHINGQKE
jgi:membrane-associated phospholipid phosphatase